VSLLNNLSTLLIRKCDSSESHFRAFYSKRKAFPERKTVRFPFLHFHQLLVRRPYELGFFVKKLFGAVLGFPGNLIVKESFIVNFTQSVHKILPIYITESKRKDMLIFAAVIIVYVQRFYKTSAFKEKFLLRRSVGSVQVTCIKTDSKFR